MKFTATFCIAALVAYVSAQAEPESSVSSTTLESVTSTVISTTSMVSDTSMMVGTPTEVMTTASTSVSMTPEESCVARCNPGDTSCQAICVSVPNPNESQVNRTTECVAACPQGSGSQADTEAYTRCRDSCITSIYLSSRSDLPTSMPTGVVGVSTSMTTTGTVMTTARTVTTSGSGSATGTGSTASVSGTTSTRTTTSTTGSGTATGATSSPTGAAAHLQIGAPVVGLAGIIAAVFAL